MIDDSTSTCFLIVNTDFQEIYRETEVRAGIELRKAAVNSPALARYTPATD